VCIGPIRRRAFHDEQREDLHFHARIWCRGAGGQGNGGGTGLRPSRLSLAGSRVGGRWKGLTLSPVGSAGSSRRTGEGGGASCDPLLLPTHFSLP
jgi:hypothetical protein